MRFETTLGVPFALAAQGVAGGAVVFTVTAPDLSTSTPAATDTTGLYTATFTPSQLGEWTVAVSDVGDVSTLDGAELTVNVSAGGLLAVPAGTGWHPGACTPAAGNLRWPCPSLASLPCIAGFSEAQVTTWLEVATTTIFGDTCQRFPGCQNYVKLRPVASSRSLCLVPRWPGHLGIDLWPTVRYPVLELVDVEIDGVSVGRSGWRIEGKRYLVPEGTTSWPSQDLHEPDGGADTWSVLVRYGRDPHPLAVKARDQLMYSMILHNEVPADPAAVCHTPEGLISLSENGRTMTFNPETATTLHDEAVKRWKCAPARARSYVFDLAERTSVNSSSMHVVPGDPTPADVQIWFPSGCDVQAQLDAITGGP